jgi:hypothetical protein
MKRLLLPIIAVLGFSFALIPEPLAIGADIPLADKKLITTSGTEVSLKDVMKKNGLLVMFSCNTCPVVIANQERTNEISTYALSKDIGVILLNPNEAARSGSESLEAMKEYAAQQNYQWYYAVDKDNELADAFGANRTPEIFLFNANGKLVYHGAIDDNPQNPESVNRKHLKIAIDELVSGKKITMEKTRSIGCTIKRIKK